ncbi:MAG: phage holin family protein [Vicinamibacterales bacterium]
MPERSDDRTLGELLSELSRETATLVRKEVELATTELSAKAQKAAAHAAVAAAGGALVHAGLLVLLAAIVIALAQAGVTPWLSALLVSLLTMGGGYLLMNRGLANLRRTDVAPRQAIEALKGNPTWTTRQGA